MMKSAYTKIAQWVVDVDGNTGDGSLIVVVHNPSVYLDFWCGGPDQLRRASEFLRSPIVGASLQIGSFCSDLCVELDVFEQEPEVVLLSVCRPDEQSMVYTLRATDCAALANAFASVVEQLQPGTA